MHRDSSSSFSPAPPSSAQLTYAVNPIKRADGSVVASEAIASLHNPSDQGRSNKNPAAPTPSQLIDALQKYHREFQALQAAGKLEAADHVRLLAAGVRAQLLETKETCKASRGDSRDNWDAVSRSRDERPECLIGPQSRKIENGITTPVQLPLNSGNHMNAMSYATARSGSAGDINHSIQESFGPPQLTAQWGSHPPGSSNISQAVMDVVSS
ncbi:hypothetical protein DFJ73DRAFT_206353 [Zopfochytrium polystomum]|nr:hypothetical protein DFJ73DRAFT_206353 [Zopfochytrium polystomum]